MRSLIQQIIPLFLLLAVHGTEASPPVPGFPKDLNKVTDLSPTKARLIVKYTAGKRWDGSPLTLSGISDLSAETADVLSGHTGTLILNGLRSISTDAATALGQHKGTIVLNGATELPVETIRLLSQQNDLVLDGLQELSPELVNQLSRRNMVSFNGIKMISLETARRLADHKGAVRLGITELTPDIALMLARREQRESEKIYLELPRIEYLSDEVVAVLSSGFGQVRAPRVVKLSDAAADSIVRGHATWDLPGLSIYSDKAGELLAYSGVEEGDPQLGLTLKPATPNGGWVRTLPKALVDLRASAREQARRQALAASHAEFVKKNALWVGRCGKCGEERGTGPQWFEKDAPPTSRREYSEMKCGNGNPPCTGPIIWSPVTQ